MSDNKTPSSKQSKDPISPQDLKATDYFMARITEVVEDRINVKLGKVNTLLYIVGVVISFVLAPAAWFTIKSLISNNVNTLGEKIYAKTDKNNLELTGKIKQIDTIVNQEIEYVSLSNDVSQIVLRASVTTEQIKRLMVQLQKVASITRIRHQTSFISLLNNIVSILVRYGYENYLNEVANLLPQEVNRSVEANRLLLSYYARKIAAITNIEQSRETPYFKKFNDYVRHAEVLQREQASLAYQIIVQFHLAGNKRTSVINKLVDSVTHLSIENKAQFLWYLLQNTNPQFWQRNAGPEDFRAAIVAERCVSLYQSELSVIAQQNGVKETLLRYYRESATPEDIRLGKYIIRYFYKLNLNTID